MADIDDSMQVTPLAFRVGTLERRADVFKERLDNHQALVNEFKEFQAEMRTFADTLTARQAAEDRIQAIRHQENIDRDGKKTSLMAIFGTIIAFLALLATIFGGYAAFIKH